MTELPQQFIWNGQDFLTPGPGSNGEILVADSWRVHDGEIWGLADHLDRFFAGITAQASRIRLVESICRGHIETALRRCVNDAVQQFPDTDLFPRISIERHGEQQRLVLLVRPAPAIRTTTSLWIPDYTDPRIRPTVKGPDIDLMRRLVAEAPADDVVLHDGTNVIETTTGALLVWQHNELVCCQAAGQLASISAQRIAKFAKSQHVTVTHRPVTIQQIASGEYSVWFANTLHGISPVTTIDSATGERLLPAHPATAAWQQAWWTRFARI